MSALTVAVKDAVFRYLDWSVDSDDAGNSKRIKDVVDNMTKGTEITKVDMVLQHEIYR